MIDLQVIHVLQAFSVVNFHTVAQQLARIQLTWIILFASLIVKPLVLLNLIFIDFTADKE